MSKLTIFWFRRDLRLEDNHALFQALSASRQVQCIFIFDTQILEKLEDREDFRVQFIHQTLSELKKKFVHHGSDLKVFHGEPLQIFKILVTQEKFEAVFVNHDYEPYARQRDEKIRQFLSSKGIGFHTFKDQVIFEKNDIISKSNKPYTMYTPYKKAWLLRLSQCDVKSFPSHKKLKNLRKVSRRNSLIKLSDLGFKPSKKTLKIKKINKSWLKKYSHQRNFVFLPGSTSQLSVDLRFGRVSVRSLVKMSMDTSESWLSELIWREFFMQILWHFPKVEKKSFRPSYDQVKWRKSRKDFERWCEGKTGYPLVDAGLRQLNATGFMHNRARMVSASFLCKHLLLPWSWGEKYFAAKLNDYDLSANNGNWQWVAGSGCDASPYFRIFNPERQQEKFDPDFKYIKTWIPEYGTKNYPRPMVNHHFAVARALRAYQQALKERVVWKS